MPTETAKRSGVKAKRKETRVFSGSSGRLPAEEHLILPSRPSFILGKATLLRSPRLPPSSSSPALSSSSSPLLRTVSASSCALTSGVRWRRCRLPGLPVMHIKATKCNRFCLVASVTNQEVFSRPEAQVRLLPIFLSQTAFPLLAIINETRAIVFVSRNRLRFRNNPRDVIVMSSRPSPPQR